MTFFERIKSHYESFVKRIQTLEQEKAQRNKEALLCSIEDKISFLKTCKLDSIDLNDLAEVDDILTIICEEYNYDTETNATTNS